MIHPNEIQVDADNYDGLLKLAESMGPKYVEAFKAQVKRRNEVKEETDL